MDQEDRDAWLSTHIPHRIRAAIAQSDVRGTLLNEQPSFSKPETVDDITWRCHGDSIWEGRLASVRWLIEFVGIRQGKDGKPKTSEPKPEGERKYDVWIEDLTPGTKMNPDTDEARVLADFWMGCTRGSSHATDASNHPPLDDRRRVQVIGIILNHLQKNIYEPAGKNIKDYVWCRSG
jgi:hypothetical protein